MRKFFNKYMLIALAACALASCGDDENYVAGEQDSLSAYGNIYFPTTAYEVELEPTEPTTYSIDIYRSDSSQAVTVPITLEGDTEVITATDATFAANQGKTTIELSFPNAEVGTQYSVTISAKNTMYLTPCTFSVNRVKWNDVGYYYDEDGNKVEGYCNYTDDLLTTFYSVNNTTHPVKVQERDDKKGYFRVFNAYGEGFYYNDPGDWDDSQDYYIFIDATNPKKVFIPSRCVQGMNWAYGNFIIYSMAGYYLENPSKGTPDDYYGTYANGKITFPVDALLFGMSGYNDGGLYSSNSNGAFKLVIDPDLDPYQADIEKDFDWDDVFTGEFSSAMLDNVSQVTLCKGTCTTTKDDCDSTFAATYGTAYAIADMYAVDYPIYFGVKDGKITLPISDPQPTGIKALNEDVYAKINVNYSSFTDKVITLNMTFTNEDGSIEYGTFDEVLSNITWSQVGTGTYTYLADMWGEGAADSGMALYQRDDDPSTYKITNWLTGVDFMFTWDSETNKCVVAEQETGYEHSSYGMIYVMETNKYSSKLAEEASSYYDAATKTFNFNVIYFVSAGTFGYGKETFALDAAVSAAKATSSKAYKAKAAKAAKKHLKKVSVKKNIKRTYNLKGKRVNAKNNLRIVGKAI